MPSTIIGGIAYDLSGPVDLAGNAHTNISVDGTNWKDWHGSYWTTGTATRAPAPTAVLDTNRTPPPQPAQSAGPSLDNVLYGNVIPISAGKRLVRGRALWWSQPRTITVPNLVGGADQVR